MEAKQGRGLRKRMPDPVLSGALQNAEGHQKEAAQTRLLILQWLLLTGTDRRTKAKWDFVFVHLSPENKSTCNCALIFILLSNPIKTEKSCPDYGKT